MGTGDVRTTVRRIPEKASTHLADLQAILDAAWVAHVGITVEDQPYVLPMACARDSDRLLLHGSTGSRLMRALAAGAPACATVTLLDGMVYARSAFESSMHYRSATVLGRAEMIAPEYAQAALRILTEHLLPGRWDQLRPPTAKELVGTMVLALPLTEWSVKISNGPPDDDPADLATPIWAGVLPLFTGMGTPVDAPGLIGDQPVPGYVLDRK